MSNSDNIYIKIVGIRVLHILDNGDYVVCNEDDTLLKDVWVINKLTFEYTYKKKPLT